MSSLFRAAALFVATCSLVWLAVLWHWQSSHRVMSTTDIAVYLGGLPLTVFALLVLMRRAWRSASRRAATRTATAAAPSGVAPQHPTGRGGDAEASVRPPLQVLSAQLCCSAGDSVDALLDATAAGEPRPMPDPLLRDDRGLPVMCARIAAIDLGDTEDLWQQALRTAAAALAGPAQTRVDESVHRAVAALASPLQRALQDLAPWADRLDAPAEQSRASAARSAEPGSGTSMLRILPCWPAHWGALERTAARAMLQHWIQQGPPQWGPSSVIWMADAENGEEALWPRIDHLFQAMERDRRADLLLVTACHSDLSETRIAVLRDQASLYTAASPRAPIPGEAAAVMVLAGPAWPTDGQAILAHLLGAAVRQRDHPVDAPGRVDHTTLTTALQQALDASSVQPDAVLGLCSDADQHTARATELLGSMLDRLPQLDAAQDTHLAGALLGQIGVAGAVLVPVLAARLALLRDGPCLGLCVGAPRTRLAVVARPSPSAA